MPAYSISDLDHHLLEPYRDLRNRNWTESSGIFIAEGPLLVERLLASSYHVRSVLIDEKYRARFLPGLPPHVDALIVDHSSVRELVGFDFHRGVLGCGVRKPRRPIAEHPWLVSEREVLAALIGIEDPENVGGILRSCAGLGIRQVVIGPGTADPLSRRSLRVSMGAGLKLDLRYSREIIADLAWLQREMNIESVATCLDDDSQPLESVHRRGPSLLLVGNECHGLPAEITAIADRRVRIAMDLATDSLNVSVAFAIVAHFLCRVAPATE